MKNPISRMQAFAKGKDLVYVVVETPKCSRIKYSYDEKIGLMTVSRALPEGMMFPFNFGFIPGTLGEDGDPLDMLILNQEALITGCFMEVRLLGVIEARQSEDNGKMTRNDRLIGVAIPKDSPTEYEEMEFTKKMAGEIEQFFTAYNEASGKKFKVLGCKGVKQARQMVLKGVKRAEKEKKDE